MNSCPHIINHFCLYPLIVPLGVYDLESHFSINSMYFILQSHSIWHGNMTQIYYIFAMYECAWG